MKFKELQSDFAQTPFLFTVDGKVMNYVGYLGMEVCAMRIRVTDLQQAAIDILF